VINERLLDIIQKYRLYNYSINNILELKPKPKRRGGKLSRQLRDNGASPPQQLELLFCIAFDAFAHNLQLLEGACKQKGAQFGAATQHFDQFDLLKKVGAPPRPASIMVALPTPAPAPVSDLREDGRGIEDRDGVGTTPQAPNGLAGRLLNIPLSNVERLRSTLSVVSLQSSSS